MSGPHRAVITGIGLVTPLGPDTESTWRALIAGRSAVGAITGFDASSLICRLGAEIVDDRTVSASRNEPGSAPIPKAQRFASAAIALALADARLSMAELDPTRSGVFLGGGEPHPEFQLPDPAAGLPAVGARPAEGRVANHAVTQVAAPGDRSTPPRPGGPAAAWRLSGTNGFLAGTEDAGAMAVVRSLRSIERGRADVVVTGGFDDPLTPWTMAKWDRFGTLTGRNELGSGACRPYDRTRSGTVLGQGAAIFVLENREHARRRGARWHAEVTGAGNSFDTYRMATPAPDGRNVARAIAAALLDAAAEPAAIGYIATHGAGTVLGDLTDARGIRRALGPAANTVAASSVKPAAGHLLAAAGALQIAVAALVLDRGFAPPTLNLSDLDSECALDWIPSTARSLRTGHALVLARGFEGQDVALVLSAVS